MTTENRKPKSKRTEVLETVAAGALLCFFAYFGYFIVDRQLNGDIITIVPGTSLTNKVELLTYNLIPGSGTLHTDVHPTQIDSPTSVTAQVTDAYSGGYYLNGTWSARSGFTVVFSTSTNAPEGLVKIGIVWPSSQTSKIRLRIRK